MNVGDKNFNRNAQVGKLPQYSIDNRTRNDYVNDVIVI